MLKIKDNVDLKELEKYGFEYEKGIIIKEQGAYCKYATSIDIVDRTIRPYYAGFSYYDYEIIYDLIKADLVEKIEDSLR